MDDLQDLLANVAPAKISPKRVHKPQPKPAPKPAPEPKTVYTKEELAAKLDAIRARDIRIAAEGQKERDDHYR